MHSTGKSSCHIDFEHFTQLGQALLHFGNAVLFLVHLKQSSTKNVWQYMPNLALLEEQKRDDFFDETAHTFENVKDNTPNFSKYTRLCKKGYVQIEASSVFTLQTQNQKTTAIGKLVFNFTHYAKLYDLFTCYHNHYPVSEQATIKFSNYWNLENYFTKPLKFIEILTLLVLIQEHCHKSDVLFVSIVSQLVSSYLPAIRAKLKPNVRLHELFFMMNRKRQNIY